MEFAKIRIGGVFGTSHYLPRDKAMKLFELLSEAVPAADVAYRLAELDKSYKGKAVARDPSESPGISLELVPEMPLPFFDQEEKIAELEAKRELQRFADA